MSKKNKQRFFLYWVTTIHKGGVCYRFDGIQWQTLIYREINVIEGLFVNYQNSGDNNAIFKKDQRLVGNAKK